MVTTRKQTEITSASVARGTDKLTHETFYVVQSDSERDTWYQVRWNTQRLMWGCNCPASCQQCKHVRAVNQVLAVRRATVALAMGGQTPAIVAKLQRAEDRKLAAAEQDDCRFNAWHGSNYGAERPIDERGSLNGQRGFSLLR